MHYWHQSCHEKENNRFIGLNSIHNLRLDHNTPCLSPEFYIIIVFKSFRSNLERLKTFLTQHVEGQNWCITGNAGIENVTANLSVFCLWFSFCWLGLIKPVLFVWLGYKHRPIRLTQCCTQFRPFGNKTFCFKNFHTFKWECHIIMQIQFYKES